MQLIVLQNSEFDNYEMYYDLAETAAREEIFIYFEHLTKIKHE